MWVKCGTTYFLRFRESVSLRSSRGSSFLSRFGFSRLFELSTPFSLPSAGISCASSQGFIQQGRAAHSFVRSRGSDRVSELHAAPKPKRQVNPTPGPSVVYISRGNGAASWLPDRDLLTFQLDAWLVALDRTQVGVSRACSRRPLDSIPNAKSVGIKPGCFGRPHSRQERTMRLWTWLIPVLALGLLLVALAVGVGTLLAVLCGAALGRGSSRSGPPRGSRRASRGRALWHARTCLGRDRN